MEALVSDFKSCEVTMPYSLNGIILFHTYGVLSGGVKLRDILKGRAYKSDGYLHSLKVNHSPISFEEKSSLESVRNKCVLPEIHQLTDGLSRARENYS